MTADYLLLVMRMIQSNEMDQLTRQLVNMQLLPIELSSIPVNQLNEQFTSQEIQLMRSFNMCGNMFSEEQTNILESMKTSV